VGRETPKVSAICCTACCPASLHRPGLRDLGRGHFEPRAALAPDPGRGEPVDGSFEPTLRPYGAECQQDRATPSGRMTARLARPPARGRLKACSQKASGAALIRSQPNCARTTPSPGWTMATAGARRRAVRLCPTGVAACSNGPNNASLSGSAEAAPGRPAIRSRPRPGPHPRLWTSTRTQRVINHMAGILRAC